MPLLTPAKIEVEEHRVKVYAGKETEEVIKSPHPQALLRGSLVSPSLEAAVMNAKYVNAVPLYREEKQLKNLPAEERKNGRQLSVKPLVEAYFAGFVKTSRKCRRKARRGKISMIP